MGDPAGIGPEIALRALKTLKSLAEFTLIGDAWVLRQITDNRGQRIEAEVIDLNNVSQKNFKFGRVRAEYGRACIEYLDYALGLLKGKKIDTLVTCPISKEAVNLAGFHYSGHTEYFSRRLKIKDSVMMLLNNQLRFSLLTRHIPLKEVAQAISSDLLQQNVLATHKALKELFGIRKPRLIVCGINPHASDNGLLGSEENKIIKPTLKKLREKFGINVAGPLSSDVAIYLARCRAYDCVIAAYHDQALIPLKLYCKDSGVNLSLGLPFIRTSPLHGTAFDIAGKNIASADSLIAAIKLAIQCTFHQRKN
jgi:4-hydroxythreonine-4-phosphate dehydrogenase